MQLELERNSEIHAPQTISAPMQCHSNNPIPAIPMSLGLELTPHAAKLSSYLQEISTYSPHQKAVFNTTVTTIKSWSY